ncbi:hypothetical protein MKW98_013295 [Papaver atlanticum]|uniref:DUF632 domain-containing protein n=1 Tax=Papaver atlanticum TaxID=357466 RepID=A0AAD4SHI6_9MAGN|nr:hypothetical protein MKW98_013295 [Papaver atlanticum]
MLLQLCPLNVSAPPQRVPEHFSRSTSLTALATTTTNETVGEMISKPARGKASSQQKVFRALSWSWSSKSLQWSKDAIESHDPNESCKPGPPCITLEKINAKEEKLYKEIKIF